MMVVVWVIRPVSHGIWMENVSAEVKASICDLLFLSARPICDVHPEGDGDNDIKVW